MNKFTTFYLVRHGQTDYNVKNLLIGSLDLPLNDSGAKQAKFLSDELKHIHFDAVFSSDLIRARRTAEIVKAERQLAVNTTKLLRERNFGSFEGTSGETFGKESRQIFEKLKIVTDKQKQKFKFEPEYESDEEIVSRFLIFLRESALAYLGKTVLVVTHGAMLRALLVHLGVAKYEELPPGSFGNSGFAKIDSDGTEFFVKELKGVNKIKI